MFISLDTVFKNTDGRKHKNDTYNDQLSVLPLMDLGMIILLLQRVNIPFIIK